MLHADPARGRGEGHPWFGVSQIHDGLFEASIRGGPLNDSVQTQ
jgi:hypothetical protein